MALYWFLFAFVGPFQDEWDKIAKSGPKWLVAVGIVIAAWLLARLARWLVRKVVSRTSTQGHVDILLARFTSGIIIFIGILLALSEVGMSLSAALAAVGLASLGIGFALQDILGNLFAGIILLIQHPFTIGDEIKVGDLEGFVENVRVRDTQILTHDGERIFIPNKTVFNSPLINYTATPSQRIEVRVPINHVEDIEAARKAAGEILCSTPGVLQQPDPGVLIESGDGDIVLVLRFWSESDRNRVPRISSDVRESLMRALRRKGIDMPFAAKEGSGGEEEKAPAADETQVMK